jgi:hypothetical protein
MAKPEGTNTEGAEEIDADDRWRSIVGDSNAVDLGDDGDDVRYDTFESELHAVEEDLVGEEAHAHASLSSSLKRVGNEFMVGNFVRKLRRKAMEAHVMEEHAGREEENNHRSRQHCAIQVRTLIELTGKETELYSEEFVEKARRVFTEEDTDASEKLNGGELRRCVLCCMPPETAEMIEEEGGNGVTVYDRSMTELINAFCLFIHDFGLQRGIDVEQFPDFVRFCLAWRLYAYFNAQKAFRKPTTRPTVDVIFVGGPYAGRRDSCCGQLLTVYHDVFQLPVSTTSRLKEEWETEGVDHYFVTEEEFEETHDNHGFIDAHMSGSTSYGYTFYSLLQPSVSWKEVCLFGVDNVNSIIGLELRKREKLLGDLRLKTVYFAAPQDGRKEPTSEVCANNELFYRLFPETWKAEIGREKEAWDLVVSGDTSEEDAMQVFEDFIHKQLNTKQHSLYKGTITRCPKRHTSEHLYEVLATEQQGSKATFVAFVTGKEFKLLYKDSLHYGFDDRAFQVFSAGAVKERPALEHVSDLVEKHTVAEKGRFNLMTFHDFMGDFSEMTCMKTKVLATVFAFIHCGRLVFPIDVLEDCWLAVGKEYTTGMQLSDHQFLHLCRNCGWLEAKKDGFDEGNALMCFMHVCRHKRKAGRAGHPSGTVNTKAHGGHLMKAHQSTDYAKKQSVDGGGRGKISSLEQFEFLMEYCADRRKVSPIEMLVDLHTAADKNIENINQAHGKTVLTRRARTQIEKKKPPGKARLDAVMHMTTMKEGSGKV